MEDKNALATLNQKQESPRTVESVGPNGPSEWGKGGNDFSVGTADEGSQKVSMPCEVDLESGYIGCKNYKKSAAGEVPDPNVKLI